MKIKFCVLILSLPAWFLILKEPKNLISDFTYQQLLTNTLAVVGFVSGCEAIEEFLITRKKNKTPNSPNELLERWNEKKKLVEYLKDNEN